MKKKSKRRLLILGTISIITIFSFLFTLGSYIYEYYSLSMEGDSLENELYQLEENKEVLKTDLIKLKDPEYIVRYAKQHYLYSENGEYVLKLDNYTEIKEIEPESNTIEILVYVASTLVILTTIYFIVKKKSHK